MTAAAAPPNAVKSAGRAEKAQKAPKPLKPPLSKAAKRKKLRRNIIAGGVFFLTLILWFGLQPLQGPITVGICRSFFELQVLYPTSLKLTEETYNNVTQLFFSYTGAFGEHHSRSIECKFTTDPSTGLPSLKAVTFDDSIKVPQDAVDLFNMTIPGIVAARPNLAIPPKPGDDLLSLQGD